MLYKTIQVSLKNNSYPIYIGTALLKEKALLHKHIQKKQIFIVSDEQVATHYLESFKSQFETYQCDSMILPVGEQYKSMLILDQIFSELLNRKHDRTTTLCALGGGVVGDLTGFAAACYRRGVPFIQLPTTLLAQVDSSIGGKTGVNHLLGKNMIGAFYQPSCVIIDVETLSTLPEREYISGLAEVIKYGLISDEKLFTWLEKNIDAILARDNETLMKMISWSAQIKLHFVERDEFEHGERALLNLGHTFGHAIETQTNYKSLLHGEAVSIGMVLAALLSACCGYLNVLAVDRIKNLLSNFGLPISSPQEIKSEHFLKHMQQDKKVIAGQLRLILLNEIGNAFVSTNYGQDNLDAVLKDFCR
ncbi:MAG: 3-dehydroquinate synthase [Gammaproteobacteria bacterium]